MYLLSSFEVACTPPSSPLQPHIHDILNPSLSHSHIDRFCLDLDWQRRNIFIHGEGWAGFSLTSDFEDKAEPNKPWTAQPKDRFLKADFSVGQFNMAGQSNCRERGGVPHTS